MPFVMFHCSDVALSPKFPFVPILVDVWTGLSFIIVLNMDLSSPSFLLHTRLKKKEKQQSCDVPPSPATLTADLAGYGSAKSCFRERGRGASFN